MSRWQDYRETIPILKPSFLPQIKNIRHQGEI